MLIHTSPGSVSHHRAFPSGKWRLLWTKPACFLEIHGSGLTQCRILASGGKLHAYCGNKLACAGGSRMCWTVHDEEPAQTKSPQKLSESPEFLVSDSSHYGFRFPTSSIGFEHQNGSQVSARKTNPLFVFSLGRERMSCFQVHRKPFFASQESACPFLAR